MNSRLEGGKLAFDVSDANSGKSEKEQIIFEVNGWAAEEDCVTVLETTDRYISYEAEDNDYQERKIYFPEADGVDRIKAALIFDEKVKEYIDLDAAAEFIYDCIDVNALAVVQHIAFLYDEPILDEDGEIEDWAETAGRQELYEKAGDGCDSYAFEVGLDTLGINWVERSAVIIRVNEIVDIAEELAKEFAADYGDAGSWREEFPREFEIGLVSTICHEFRHSVYEMNELINTIGDDPRYPWDGGVEEEVEDYGNEECERLRDDPAARQYIAKMVQPTEDKMLEKHTRRSTQEFDR